jgi:UDP-N-acetylmuramoyl-L-alanyl-D-glutamate--2,6-diaminopimelate ligase
MAKTLFEILKDIPVIDVTGPDPAAQPIQAIRFDSRLVQPGDLFVAVRGVGADGHQFVDAALEKGAVAIVCDTRPALPGEKTTVILVDNTTSVLGLLAANFYGHPARQLKLVGITGTNGKTTTVTLLWQLFTRLGYRCGLIGTVENRIGSDIIPSTHTTPDAVSLHQLLGRMVEAGCTYAFMEVSSHAIHQQRIAGVEFTGAAFSNITHDHLDYHNTFAEYRDVKKLLFDRLPASAFALTNADDKNGLFMMQNTRAAIHTYGLKKPAAFKARIVENSLTGLYMQLDGEMFHARMIGEFNAYNLTATYACARLLGVGKIETLTALSDLNGAEGRFDHILHPTKNCIGIVDYAHTPDAVEKVLETIRKLKKHGAKVITVIGCGGDRDKTKRPLMARVAAQMSDHIILTSDNPRTEDPSTILKEMEAGLHADDLRKTLTIENREQAIKTACQLAGTNDIILVAGKGHEKYQDIRGVKHPFDDKAVLLKFFNE